MKKIYREKNIIAEMEQLCKLKKYNLDSRLQGKEQNWTQGNKGTASQREFFQYWFCNVPSYKWPYSLQIFNFVSNFSFFL